MRTGRMKGSQSELTWQWWMVCGKRRHTKIEASWRRSKKFTFLHIIWCRWMFGFRFMLVTTRRCRWSIRCSRTRIRRILIMGTCATIASSQFQRFALYRIFYWTVILMNAISLNFIRQVIFDHRKIRRRCIIVVERWRYYPGSFYTLVVWVGGMPFVSANLRPAQQLLYCRRCWGYRSWWWTSSRETLIIRLFRRRYVVATGSQRTNMRELNTPNKKTIFSEQVWKFQAF